MVLVPYLVMIGMFESPSLPVSYRHGPKEPMSAIGNLGVTGRDPFDPGDHPPQVGSELRASRPLTMRPAEGCPQAKPFDDRSLEAPIPRLPSDPSDVRLDAPGYRP